MNKHFCEIHPHLCYDLCLAKTAKVFQRILSIPFLNLPKQFTHLLVHDLKKDGILVLFDSS